MLPKLDALLAHVSKADRLAIMALGAQYFQSIIDDGRIVRDKLTNENSWSAERRGTVNMVSDTTLSLRATLKTELNRVLGGVHPRDFDATLLIFMLGRS